VSAIQSLANEIDGLTQVVRSQVRPTLERETAARRIAEAMIDVWRIRQARKVLLDQIISAIQSHAQPTNLALDKGLSDHQRLAEFERLDRYEKRIVAS
jgi:hypothetical protein